MHCASLGYDTAHLAHLRSALAERGGTAGRQETGQRPGNPGIAEAAKLGRAALKANARRFAMTISTLLLILLLTFGTASALDRFVQSHWLHEALTRARFWGRDTHFP